MAKYWKIFFKWNEQLCADKIICKMDDQLLCKIGIFSEQRIHLPFCKTDFTPRILLGILLRL